jgi:hypothetical protein
MEPIERIGLAAVRTAVRIAAQTTEPKFKGWFARVGAAPIDSSHV